MTRPPAPIPAAAARPGPRPRLDLSRLITAEARAAEALTSRRAGMVCSRLQGRLTLGPDACARLDAIADDPTTPWALRETIRHAAAWLRTLQAVDALA